MQTEIVLTWRWFNVALCILCAGVNAARSYGFLHDGGPWRMRCLLAGRSATLALLFLGIGVDGLERIVDRVQLTYRMPPLTLILVAYLYFLMQIIRTEREQVQRHGERRKT